MTSTPSLPPSRAADDHWKFLRDVLVFQLKMLLDNVRDFALMPVSLVAALISSSKANATARFSIRS